MKNVWLLVSCLIVAAVLMASCAPAAVEEEGKTVTGKVVEKEEAVKEEEEVVTEEKEMVRDSIGRLVEKPEYGGLSTVATTRDTGFSPAPLNTHWIPALMYESLINNDWTRGASGTGEFTTLLHDWWKPPESMIGLLAESWEQPDVTTFIFHMRKGVRFHNIPPANGREMVADDVVFSINWHQNKPRSILYKVPGTPEEKLFKAVALDKYTVKVLMPEPDAMVLNDWPVLMRVLPHEVGDRDLEEWTDNCGTGPFITTDYVAGSSTVTKSNPDYWMNDPLHPDNRLPYIEGIKQLVIPDSSTQQAALRTGKIDFLFQVPRLEGKKLIETAPHLKSVKSLRDYDRFQLSWRADREPFNDKRVRQALHMAVDWDSLVEDYFDGEATKLTWPYYSYQEGYYTPLEELPEDLQALFDYNPERAKQLLAEAGYPDGFKTEIICGGESVEPLSLLKAWFADVGVDMEIKVMEVAARYGIGYGKKYEQMWTWHSAQGNAAPEMVYRQFYKPNHPYNMSIVDDAHINEEYNKVSATLDPVEQKRIMKELGLYTIDQCYMLIFPSAYAFTVWQPWVKVYAGELYTGTYWHYFGFLQYCWIDEDLKAELGF